MSAATEWRTLFGVVQFDPTPRNANGKDVLSISLRTAGVKEQSQMVSCTLWPSHAALFEKVQKGDAVVVEGKYSVNKGQDKEGNPRTYHNLSISRILLLGPLDGGSDVEVTSGGEDEPDDDAW